jgi:retron-type reverse transcriptase
VLNGTRQGSVISPTLFNVFVNLFIVQLRKLNAGCVVRSLYIGCLLYADDIIILCPSIKGLQCMLNNCAITADAFSLTFSKSVCLAIGKLAQLPFQPVLLGSSHIE